NAHHARQGQRFIVATRHAPNSLLTAFRHASSITFLSGFLLGRNCFSESGVTAITAKKRKALSSANKHSRRILTFGCCQLSVEEGGRQSGTTDTQFRRSLLELVAALSVSGNSPDPGNCQSSFDNATGIAILSRNIGTIIIARE